MDDETYEALKGSIRKWALISVGLGTDEGILNCPLCRLPSDNYQCLGCPVPAYSGYPNCVSTPYVAWSHHSFSSHQRSPFHGPLCGECRTIANRELMFLQRLLEKENERRNKR